MADLSDSDGSSAADYSSPEDDEYNMSETEDEDDDDELGDVSTDHEKTKAVREGFSLHRHSMDSNSPETPGGKYLSTQPASQSSYDVVSSAASKKRRISPRRKSPASTTGAIVGVMNGETNSMDNVVIPKKPKFRQQQQQQTHQPEPKKPPMKKRKVSLSPTDSLARQRPSNRGRDDSKGEEVIDLFSDDDDDVVATRSNPKSPTLGEIGKEEALRQRLAAANKQQKEHVAATKQKQKNASEEKASSKKADADRTKETKAPKKRISKVSEVSYSKDLDGKPNEKLPSTKTAENKSSATKTKAKMAKTSKDAKAKTNQAAGKVAEKPNEIVSEPQAAVAKGKKKTAEATKPALQKKTKKKKRITFEDELLQKMFMTCRPYSIRDLVQLMGKTASEASVNFCLLSLTDKKWVVKKEFKSGSNRTKELYWANQESKDKKLWALECLQLPDQETIRQGRMELAALQQQQKSVAREIEAVERTPSNQQLAILCQNVQKQVDDLSAKLDAMKKRIGSSDATNSRGNAKKLPGNRFGGRTSSFLHNRQNQAPKKKATPLQLKKRINSMRDHWIKRKRKCMDFVESLADGMEKKVKDVVNKVLELETDDAEQAVLPPKHVL